jgi:integrase
MHAYIVLCLLLGVRTEEAQALRWDHVDLDGRPDADPAVPPGVAVWRSVRAHGDTKTGRSRRTLGPPRMAVDALRDHRESQQHNRAAGDLWQDHGLVFATQIGTPLDAGDVRRRWWTNYSDFTLNCVSKPPPPVSDLTSAWVIPRLPGLVFLVRRAVRSRRRAAAQA